MAEPAQQSGPAQPTSGPAGQTRPHVYAAPGRGEARRIGGDRRVGRLDQRASEAR